MKKKGIIMSSVIISIIILFVGFIFIYNIFTMMKPCFVYQSIYTVISRYIFIYEKFGYLTEEEITSLNYELSKLCTNKNYELSVPTEKKQYGDEVNFKFNYLYSYYTINLNEKGFIRKKKTIPIKINRYSYVKN